MTKKKEKLDPNDPLTPVKIYMEEYEAICARAVEVTQLARSRGASIEDIATVMNVSPRTVYNRLDGVTPQRTKGKQ